MTKAATCGSIRYMTRIVTSEGWTIKQVRLSDGTWWNISVERVVGL